MEALGRNIIEVFKGFTSQEGLEIFTSSFILAKLVEKRFCYVEESFHEAVAGLVTCIMMIIRCFNFLNRNKVGAPAGMKMGILKGL